VQVGSIKRKIILVDIPIMHKPKQNLHVEGLGIQNTDVAGTQAVGQSLEFGQNPRLGHIQIGWYKHLSKINLKRGLRSMSGTSWAYD